VRRARLCVVGTILTLAGCWNPYGEILAEHITPGGVVRVTLDGGAPTAAAGLVAAKAEPLTVTAYSPDLTFGLELDKLADGTLPRDALAKEGGTLSVAPGASARLQAHAGGRSCVADAGTISLTVDAGGKTVTGAIDATGVLKGTTGRCQLVVTLTGIPVERN
jgi:hypothetical protein